MPPKKKKAVAPPSAHHPLVARCVDASLSSTSWQRMATWLPISTTILCHPSVMFYGSKTCASKALNIYLGETVPTLPSHPTKRMVCDAARARGRNMSVLYDAGDSGEEADRCLLFGTVPSEEGGRSGARGCLIPVKGAGTGDAKAIFRRMKELLHGGVRKMMLIVYNPALYPLGHCICVKKVGDAWYLSDPLMPAGACMKLPGEDALALLMAGVTTILGV